MKKFTGILFIWLCACTSPEREIIVSTEFITDNPPSQFSHWNGDSGILARFGPGSEIGALMHYGWVFGKNFIIFDGTGKQFINDSSGVLSGPFPVKDLFRQPNLRFDGLNDTSVTNSFAAGLENHGVESAVYSPRDGASNIPNMTLITKDGTRHVLIAFQNDVPEVKDGDYGVTSHNYNKGALEALLYDERIGGFYPCYISDETGKSFVDGDNNYAGLTRDIWEELPSAKIEAMGFYTELGPVNKNIATTILVLGEENNISNGQFVYYILDNGTEVIKKLVDLRKD